jgi:hypothetical protein
MLVPRRLLIDEAVIEEDLLRELELELLLDMAAADAC